MPWGLFCLVGCGGISVSAGVAADGFALTATHFFYKRLKKVSKKTLAPTCGPLAGARGSFAPGSIRAQRLRFASLHLLSLRLAAPNGRCAPTPGSIPPLSLPTSPYRSRAAAELTLILLSGEERVFGFGFVVDSPLTPALSRGRGGRFVVFSRFSLNSVSQVGVLLPVHAVSPLSLWERVRVRGF
jgi:hypothetical protein